MDTIGPGVTRDNLHLSRPTENSSDRVEINLAVSAYVQDSVAENSRRAYRSDLAQFELWGGAIPASPEMVASYMRYRCRYGDHWAALNPRQRSAHFRVMESSPEGLGRRADGVPG